MERGRPRREEHLWEDGTPAGKGCKSTGSRPLEEARLSDGGLDGSVCVEKLRCNGVARGGGVGGEEGVRCGDWEVPADVAERSAFSTGGLPSLREEFVTGLAGGDVTAFGRLRCPGGRKPCWRSGDG